MASGTLLFPSIFTDLLNPVMVTSLPILLYPMFDTDVAKEDSLAMPQLYSAGITRIHYTRPRLIAWVFEGIYTAAVCAYLPTFLTDGDDGTISVSEVAMAAMWTVCITIDVRLILENHSWTGLDIFGVWAMMLVLLIWTIFFSFINNDDPGSFGWGFLYGTVNKLFTRVAFWLVLWLSVLLSLAPRALFLGYQCIFRGSKLLNFASDANSRLTANSKLVKQKTQRVTLPGVVDGDFNLGREKATWSMRGSSRGESELGSGPRSSYRADTEPTLLNRGAAAFSVDPASANHILRHGQDGKYSSKWAKVRAVSHLMSELRAHSTEHPMRI